MDTGEPTGLLPPPYFGLQPDHAATAAPGSYVTTVELSTELHPLDEQAWREHLTTLAQRNGWLILEDSPTSTEVMLSREQLPLLMTIEVDPHLWLRQARAFTPAEPPEPLTPTDPVRVRITTESRHSNQGLLAGGIIAALMALAMAAFGASMVIDSNPYETIAKLNRARK